MARYLWKWYKRGQVTSRGECHQRGFSPGGKVGNACIGFSRTKGRKQARSPAPESLSLGTKGGILEVITHLKIPNSGRRHYLHRPGLRLPQLVCLICIVCKV